MSTHELVSKAKLLDEKIDCAGVVETLEKYVRSNADDTVALALYQKNLAMKNICELDVNIDEIMGADEKSSFNNVPEKSVMKVAEDLFVQWVAGLYLKSCSEEDREKLLFGYIYRTISSLGDRLHDYDTFKSTADKLYTVMETYGFAKYFYRLLTLVVDWRSKTSENILKYLVETVNTVAPVVSDKDIFNDYIKDMPAPAFTYSDKPYLSGGRLVIVDIKTQEALDFWKGYFTLLRTVRQKEYDNYKQAMADENSKLHGLLKIGEYIHNHYLNAIMKRLASSADVAKMQVATGCGEIGRTERDYADALHSAQLCCDTIKMNPIEQLKQKILGLFGKK